MEIQFRRGAIDHIRRAHERRTGWEYEIKIPYSEMTPIPNCISEIPQKNADILQAQRRAE